ncbi:MAG TPA: hypothetical protein VLN45_12785 [Ignavibacteriaceae bacterium]|nr:hypothetical protein [Ignavibacteriaceae bacterium]
MFDRIVNYRVNVYKSELYNLISLIILPKLRYYVEWQSFVSFKMASGIEN